MTEIYGKQKVFDGGLTPGSECYMGIDQSLTGFAVTFIDTEDKYITYVFKANGSGIVRLFNIASWLEDLLVKYKVIDIAMEAPVKMSHSAIISGELFGMVRMELYEHFLEPACFPLQVSPAMLKKFVTGKGTGVQKNQMLLQVYKKWGVEFNDDNAADSYGLARIVRGDQSTAYEKEIQEKLKDPKFRDTNN
jgi:Holliday junction resolvasome RuvABC endonuclease subunit